MSMNAFFVVVLVALLSRLTLHSFASWLNLRALAAGLPPALSDLYRGRDYRKTQEYVRAVAIFGLWRGAFTLSVTLAFWFSGGFDWLDGALLAYGLGPIVTGLLYVGALALAYAALMLPFDIYGTFGVEERFGFNRTAPRTFLLDRVKMLVLAAALGGPLLASILALFQYAGGFAWLYCWAAVTAFSLVLGYVAPTWIMPLFNKFTPLGPGELRDAILSFARSVRFPVKNIFVMDGSKRSSKSNAFFTGFGRSRRIALFDTLVAQHTTAELVAVLAHEVGHYKKKHILQGVIIGVAHTGVIFLLLSVFVRSPGLYAAFSMELQPIYAGLLFFGLLYAPLDMALSVAMNAVSRRNELAADRFAAEAVDDPRSVGDALKKLAANDRSNLTPHPFYVILNYSHPTLLRRIEGIEAVKRRRGGSGASQL